MREDKRQQFRLLSRSLGKFQDSVQKSGPAASASYSLIGAIVFLGGLGYAFDSWRGSSPWGLVIGLLLGLVVGFYELAKAVWHR